MKIGVERPRAERAALHRAENLNVANWVEAKAPRNPVADNFHDLRRSLLGIVGFDKPEIRILAALWPFRHFTAIDPVRVDDDPTLGGLTKHLGQPRDRYRAGIDNVIKHLLWPDRGKLIDVADEQERRPSGNRLGERKHQRDIDHAGFVDDEQIAIERIVDPAFASGPFGALYGLLSPSSIDVNTGGRLVRIDQRHSEYFLFQTFWVLFKSLFTHDQPRDFAALETQTILDA